MMILVVNPFNFNIVKPISKEDINKYPLVYLENFGDIQIAIVKDYFKIAELQTKANDKEIVMIKYTIIRYQQLLNSTRGGR